MEDSLKKELHLKSQEHIETVSKDITEKKRSTEISIKTLETTLRKGESEDPEVLISIILHRLETKQQLDYSYRTPYFVRCDVKFDDEASIKTLYFGRFSFMEDYIYSWIAPAAAIRFESPGNFTYLLPDGNERKGKLCRKDQFMIINRRIVFMSTETINNPRELVYQEHFSEQKQGFALPEIVEQMEKAQDKIIRSHYFGSFLISGAAGSGKTTIALHRVAYLVQSPETSQFFNPFDILVFVQDSSTKKYFSNLLPTLGINHVKITTFDEWAMRILDIKNMQFIVRYGANEEEKDSYEFSKAQALKNIKNVGKRKEIKKMLEDFYASTFDSKQIKLLKKQLSDNLLDRFDLTMLLKQELDHNKLLIETVKKYVQQKKTRHYVKKLIRKQVKYDLVIMDEMENYLKEQIQIIKTCVNDKTNALIYVGDIKQQTLLWTIKDLEDVDEHFESDRKIELHKVYRNTRQILEYIKEIGYHVDIPSQIKNGEVVEEKIFTKKLDELNSVEKILEKDKGSTIGILAKNDDYLMDYKKKFDGLKNVIIITFNEAQGVEFENVILVGLNKELFKNNNIDKTILIERQRVNRDLLYVALTRATSKLYVFGNYGLENLLKTSKRLDFKTTSGLRKG
jgi:DNA helicase IV